MIEAKSSNVKLRAVVKKGFFAVASLLSLHAWATPAIHAIEGDIKPHAEIRISGSGFLSGSRSFELKDNSDSFSFLTLSKALSVNLQSDLWQTKGSPWAAPLLPVPLEEADKTRVAYQGKGKTYNQYINPIDGENNDTLYVSWLYKPSESPGHSGGSNKFIRVWDNHNGEDTRISWTGMHLTYSGYTKPSWAGWSGNVNEWNKMEIWVDGPAGRIEARINGKVVHNVDDFVKKPNGIGLNVKLLGFDPSSSTPYANMITQIDDLYVSTTRARVVLSDQSTWSAAMLDGVAVIPSSWSDSEITLNLDVAERELTDKKYLYVVDKDGIANAGGYQLCIRCPKPPQLTAN